MANYENGNVYGGVSTVENPAEFKPAGVPRSTRFLASRCKRFSFSRNKNN